MFFSFSFSRRRAWLEPFHAPLGLMIAGALAPAVAKAQAAPYPASSPADKPRLTLTSQPQSAIAPSVHAVALAGKGRTSLVIAVPAAGAVSSTAVAVTALAATSSSAAPASARSSVPTSGVVSAVAVVATGGLNSFQTPRAAARIDGKHRVEVLAPERGKDGFSKDGLSAVSVLAPIPVAPNAVPLAATNSVPSEGRRTSAAQLPSRGGLMIGKSPVELRPEAANPPSDAAPSDAAPTDAAPSVSAAQRLMLARLDADLGRAQTRLSRAETRLSEGQRQLGEATDVLRNAMLDAGDDARGLHPFVRVAQRYLGTPYVWGGESARGFDCSGFIMRVMRDLGYRALPHSAAEQFRYGLPIAKPLLKAGDIVFFANTYKPGISHVGIYLGHGRFIHAANSHVGTIVSSLNEPKWVEKYAGARRLLPISS